ncbi:MULTISPECIES: TonB-dependent receptor [Ignavibacterium]|uniref:TonB-dependent receptor n=1 Tax=Ignavibacterium TaxID=795750 RepID=UPI0025C1D959|nr:MULTISPECIES: TonB-dependent receptor [Ignavibacterium]MBI5660653.1 TonB-dependent receptor [Ignavibacterium album]
MKKMFLIFLLFSFHLFAGTTGKLAGVIKDADSGEPLVGANILIEGTSFGAATNANGEYVILNIPPGRYNVRISFIGYETVLMQNVAIVVDQTTNLSVNLKPQTVQVGEVVVTAKTPLIQKDLTSSISVISRDEIEALPVSTFTELLSLQAGVVGSGSNLHVRGGRSNEIAYMIDGMLVVDPLLGGLATQVNNDAIQEMSLLSGTFNAEYGNALSGVVNIVTRDGSDKLSGKFEYRTSEFGIDRYSSLHESRVNGSLSGPLLTNDLKFFISAEQDKRGSYLPFGYNNDRTFFTKLTTTVIPFVKISLSNRGSLGRRQSYNHAWKYIPEQYLRRRTDSWQTGLYLTHTVENNFFYDLKFSYFNQGFYSGIDKDTSQYLSTSQREYLPIGTGFEFFSKADPLELIDSRTVTLDGKLDAVWQFNNTNEVKFGASYKKHRLKYFYVYDPKRNYPYKNDYVTEPFELAGYIQDKIELPYLVINLGLRFDYMNANITFRNNPLDPGSLVKAKPRSQLSPRVGIAHPISDRTKLHFSYGHFFQNPDFQYLFENNQYDLNVREPLIGQPGLDAQRTISYEVGIAHQFSDRIAINLTTYYKDITGLIGTRYYFPFQDGRFIGYTLYVNEDYANVKGFEINLDIRPDRYFSGGLSYTYSIAKGSASSETEQYPGTQESTLLYYLDFDRTHVLNVTGSYTIPENEGPVLFDKHIFDRMDFSLVFRASSGAPYTPGGRDVGFVIKNSLRQPGTYTLDLMIGKEFEIMKQLKIRLFAEILNVTDHRNILYVYRDTGEPDFTFEGNHSVEWMRDPSNFGPPRSIRLGTTIRF